MQRKRHTAEFKAKVALESLKGIEPVHTIAQKHQIHPVQIAQWQKHLLDNLPQLFERGSLKKPEDVGPTIDELYRQIGQLKFELEWVKKKSATFT